MFLTAEDLRKKRACGEGLEEFEKLYPNGVDTWEALNDPKTSASIIHWGYLYTDPPEEEKIRYCERFEIVNCENFCYSKRIENCNSIVHSQKCKNSSYIKKGVRVEDSSYVVDSQKIQKSEKIFNSKEVVNSVRVGFSTDVFESQDVFKGIKVYRSRGVIESGDITNCIAVRKSSKLADSLYCALCENSANLLFCSEQKAQDYLLFNKPISEEDFDAIRDKILSFGAESVYPTFSFGDFPDYKDTGFDHFTIHFSEELEAFIKTLPNYDPFILFKITHNLKYLKEVGPK